MRPGRYIWFKTHKEHWPGGVNHGKLGKHNLRWKWTPVPPLKIVSPTRDITFSDLRNTVFSAHDTLFSRDGSLCQLFTLSAQRINLHAWYGVFKTLHKIPAANGRRCAAHEDVSIAWGSTCSTTTDCSPPPSPLHPNRTERTSDVIYYKCFNVYANGRKEQKLSKLRNPTRIFPL